MYHLSSNKDSIRKNQSVKNRRKVLTISTK